MVYPMSTMTLRRSDTYSVFVSLVYDALSHMYTCACTPLLHDRSSFLLSSTSLTTMEDISQICHSAAMYMCMNLTPISKRKWISLGLYSGPFDPRSNALDHSTILDPPHQKISLFAINLNCLGGGSIYINR